MLTWPLSWRISAISSNVKGAEEDASVEQTAGKIRLNLLKVAD
jgi:hypothetical protein